MAPLKALLSVAFFSCLVGAQVPGSWGAPGTEWGEPDLVEVNIRGVVHGKCSFYEDGEFFQVTFKESPTGVLMARASSSSVDDPIAKAMQCRGKARNTNPLQPNFRTLMDEPSDQLQRRVGEVDTKPPSNTRVADDLEPRFFGPHFKTYLRRLGTNTYPQFGLKERFPNFHVPPFITKFHDVITTPLVFW